MSTEAPRRVLVLTPLYIPWVGGLEIFVRQLVQEMRGRGHEFTIITSHTRESTSGWDEVDGVPVLRVPAHGAIQHRDAEALFHVQREITTATRAFAPDVVHTHDAGPILWMYLRSERRRPRPLVVTLHNVMTHHFDGALDLLGMLVERAGCVTGVSQDVIDDALVYAPGIAGRTEVIHNGVAPTVAVPTPVPVDPPRLLCLGRLVEQKGFDRAIRALATLAPRRPDVRMVIAGDGPERRSLEALADELGVASQVEFLGLVDHAAIPGLLESVTAVLMPSRFEGLPLVALEAAWSARPVIATRAPGLDRAVVHGETALVVDADPVAIAGAIVELLDDPALAQRLGDGARAFAEREYSISASADAYERLYRRLTADGTATGR